MISLITDTNIIGKKNLFNELLSISLAETKYKVFATYEWKNPEQIFGFQFLDNQKLKLSINLNFGGLNPLNLECGLTELEVKFRAYFIANYIQCMNSVGKDKADSYYRGLIDLCAVNNIIDERKRIVLSPIHGLRNKVLRPIDICCAIGAITRLKVEDAQLLADKQDDYNVILESLILYTVLPEVGYKNRRPVYALLQELQGLKEKSGKKPVVLPKSLGVYLDIDLTDDYRRKIGAVDIQMSKMCETSIVIRLAALSGRNLDMPEKECITKSVQSFRERTVNYSRDYINSRSNMLTFDNYTAIKRLASRIDRIDASTSPTTGALHLYQ